MATNLTSHERESITSTFTVLVTGANSGLGFSICLRLIDEFLLSRPSSQRLHLLFSTRDKAKSEDTLSRLTAHVRKTTTSIPRATDRVILEGVLVDLTRLGTVKALAQRLVQERRRLDAVVWNAGIAGWKGLDYPRATWSFFTGLIQATTFPQFMICDVGAVAGRQIDGRETNGVKEKGEEPVLGRVFTANVFGHYMLTHWLLPTMSASSRIVWVSSISALPHTFSASDLQGLRASMSYESSKRLTDLLVLTSHLPSTNHHVSRFLGPEPSKRPKMFVTHPGVIATTIFDMNILIHYLMVAATFLARWLGSPWHLIDPYKGAVSAVYAVLSPASQMLEMEEQDGKGKWGSACDVYGRERVGRTEVEGWGFGGRVGEKPSGSLASGRTGYAGVTREEREDFEVLGGRVWGEMEGLRGEWEGKLSG